MSIVNIRGEVIVLPANATYEEIRNAIAGMR